MVNAAQLRLNAGDRSYFAILKKEVHALAVSAGFSARRLGEVDIVVAEIVSNLAKHASGGELFVKLIEEKDLPGIEILSVDHGPGISDLKSMMQDGMSTKDTLGNGLGSIKRLSDHFQIYTQKGWGTLVLSRIFDREPGTPEKRGPVEIRALISPKPGETVCGDGFAIKQSKEHVQLFLGDGLGHGKEAALAVNCAMEAFEACRESNTVEILRHINESVKRTRGLVATVAVFHIQDKQWRICGVGNISSRIFGPQGVRNHSPYNGIVGLNMPKTMNENVMEYEQGQTIVLCSDGIRSKWDILKFPGILRHDLSLLNAAVFRDFSRNTDDMSVASCKISI